MGDRDLCFAGAKWPTEDTQKVVKYCRAEYSPLRGSTLRVGTLAGYRANENTAIRDSREGSYVLHFNFQKPTTVSRDWLRAISFGTSLLSDIRILGRITNVGNLGCSMQQFDDTMGIVCTNESFIHGTANANSMDIYGRWDVSFLQSDTLIFCMSCEDGVGSVINDEAYNSRWYVPMAKIGDFVEVLLRAVQREIRGFFLYRTPDFSPYRYTLGPPVNGLLPVPGAGLVYLEAWAGLVTYESRSIIVRNPSDVTRDGVEDRFRTSAFRKDIDFSSEKEFRIVISVLAKVGEHFFKPSYHFSFLDVSLEDLRAVCEH